VFKGTMSLSSRQRLDTYVKGTKESKNAISVVSSLWPKKEIIS